MTLTLDGLSKAVARDAAIRRLQVLQPVGGQGDKIFPPTYPGEGRNNPPPVHVFEKRRLDGAEIWCVLVDSVQSQANRLEECLLEAIHEDLAIPYVVVDFRDAGLEGITEITSLDAPHRVYDAILRDSLNGEQPFMESEVGQRLAKASMDNATALLEVSPTALLFGAWHSTGEGGGVGAKFARCLISEIVAIDVPIEDFVINQRTGEIAVRTSGRRPGSRIDPLGVLRRVEIYRGDAGWSTSQDAAGNKAKPVRPSEINHGNIAPSVTPLGITCERIDHSFVLSFAALRRLRFGNAERDRAARCLLATLGLVALAEQDARGYALRSRCDLVCQGQAPLELVHSDGTTDALNVDRVAASKLYDEALTAARDVGFTLTAEPLRLTPQEKLVCIVRQSQELALSGEGGEADESAESA